MQQKRRFLLILGILILVILVAALFFFRYRPLVEGDGQLSILSISITWGKDGKSENYDISNQEDIPQELNEALGELFRGIKIRHTLFPSSKIYYVEDNSVYITIKVGVDSSQESWSFRVNLCSDATYNSVHRKTTLYHIADGKALFQQVYALLKEALPLPTEAE